MKKIISVLLLHSTTTLLGSSFQEECGNSEGTIRISRGMVENTIEVTRQEGSNLSKVILNNAEAIEVNSDFISDEKYCNFELGLKIWKQVYFRKFIIKSITGESFHGIIGAEWPDYKTIRADMICEFGASTMDGSCWKD